MSDLTTPIEDRKDKFYTVDRADLQKLYAKVYKEYDEKFTDLLIDKSFDCKTINQSNNNQNKNAAQTQIVYRKYDANNASPALRKKYDMAKTICNQKTIDLSKN